MTRSEEEMLVLASKFESIVSPLIKPFPTNDIIAKCFLISFEMAKTFYTREMLPLKVRHCIRIDHTFKVASNIGYHHDDKKRLPCLLSFPSLPSLLCLPALYLGYLDYLAYLQYRSYCCYCSYKCYCSQGQF